MNELVKIDVSYEYAPKVYVYKRNSGWFWKFKLPGGKWFYGIAPGDDEKSANRNANRKERELAKGLFTQKEVDRLQKSSNKIITFKSAIDDYIDHLKSEGASPNYFKKSKISLKAIAAIFENEFRVKYVHKVTEDDAYNFRKYLLKKVEAEEMKRVSSFNVLNEARRLFKWLRKRKKILENPFREIDAIKVPREEKARTVAPTHDIVPRLLSANYKHRYEFPIKEFAYGLYRTGARLQELLYLEVSDVDWQTGRWVIQTKKCPTKHGDSWSPKYAKTRVTFIPGDVLDMMKPLVERALNHRVVGYMPDGEGVRHPVEAKFIFTAIDRHLTRKGKEKVFRRVDCIRGAWGALFVAAGLAERKESSGGKAGRYKNGIKLRTDVQTPFTRHDMRRGFNLEAKKAGMSLDDRSLILGHGRSVNENNYCGKAELDTSQIAETLNNKMWKVEAATAGEGMVPRARIELAPDFSE